MLPHAPQGAVAAAQRPGASVGFADLTLSRCVGHKCREEQADGRRPRGRTRQMLLHVQHCAWMTGEGTGAALTVCQGSADPKQPGVPHRCALPQPERRASSG